MLLLIASIEELPKGKQDSFHILICIVLLAGVQMHQVPPDMYMREYDAFAQEEGADARLLSYAQAHSILRDPDWENEEHHPHAI